MKLLTIIGARPQFIKAAMAIRAIVNKGTFFQVGKQSEMEEKYNRRWNLRGNPNELAKLPASPCPCSTEFPGRTESNNKTGKVGTSPIEEIQSPEDVEKRPNVTAGNPENLDVSGWSPE